MRALAVLAAVVAAAVLAAPAASAQDREHTK
jgi:hypothetical protein